MAVKIDLAKAYDRVDWSFLKETLLDFGFPMPYISLILACVAGSKLSVVWNGQRLEAFQSRRGLRQGDPLSPYLFVLCMEKLSLMIEKRVLSGEWEPITTSSNGPKISHLLFADEVILFSKVSVSQAKLMRLVLSDFCACSGMGVNNDKSKAYVSEKVRRGKRERVKIALGIPISQSLGSYLGVPLHTGRRKRSDYMPILDKVKSRLAGWQCKLLNRAGRITLVQDTLSVIPLYVMQSTWLPRSVCDEVDKMARRFLWGRSDNQRGIHLVAWDTVTMPKICGGLGLRQARDSNTALFGKVCWDLINGKECLWTNIIRNKYLGMGDLFCHSCPRAASHIWKGTLRSLSLLRDGYGWRIGDGSTVNVWHDIWVADNKLKFLVNHVPQSLDHLLVSDLLSSSSGWNLDIISAYVPKDVIAQIQAVPISVMMRPNDQRIWWNSPTGKYTAKDGFDYLTKVPTMGGTVGWSWIWKNCLAHKHKVFLWLAAWNRLPTNVVRFERSLCHSPLCSRCGSHAESVIHLLRDCVHARCLWTTSVVSMHVDFFAELNVFEWLRGILSRAKTDMEWGWKFIATCWTIWKARNKATYEGQVIPIDMQLIQLKHLFHDYKEAYGATNIPTYRPEILVSWQAPPVGWLKLNVDGSVLGNPGEAGIGGLIRDETGKFIKGFSCHIGVTNIMVAELMAIRFGLSIAQAINCDRLEIGSDSKEAIRCIDLQEPDLQCHPLALLIQDIRELLRSFREVKVSHTFREGNHCADFLAHLGSSYDVKERLWLFPPPGLNCFLIADVQGIAFSRR